ncbi:COP9 signalosome complex subunit 1 [Microsporum canis CBS 113480]|uniref:COP9 signalosome complex subunit 1 n=1 Tax=Arthroderma otae (strain ATCC MYA-4605 / CBS 113480) TaxID=554155 RepID=C5FX63_ARTOC|nr:COP9 signalosome complex subunit 1 [Microsporum canis CBS 113480]EEQ34903.1 COP9 signalosome complex subunit 1 [Microsporum canis CBS 113480]
MDIESVVDHQRRTSTASPRIIVDEPPKFDLETYISNYTGRTKFARLYLIGTCSSYLSVDALKMAVAEAKSGKDVKCYENAVEALSRAAPSDNEAVLDTEWINYTTKLVKADTSRLERELKGYKNNLIKESIRMGNEDLGQHYHRIGDLTAASHAFSRMRDFCTTTSHIASMLFKNIIVAVDRSDWLGVQANVHRLRSLQFKPEDEAKSKAKLVVSLGLSQLAANSYLEAATTFLATDPALGDNYKEVISPNDVAVYGGLCALASMDRIDLAKNVLENKSFRNFLELEPHIRQAISFFCASKFRLCLDILEAYRADYLLDLHLQKHVWTLYRRIRTKAVQQYIIPYSRVTLDGMAKVFSPKEQIRDEQGMIKSNGVFVSELITLIQNETLDAKIDFEKGVLVTGEVPMREKLHERALESMRDYMENAHLQLLRINVLNATLEIPATQAYGIRTEADAIAAAQAASLEDQGQRFKPASRKGIAAKLGAAFGES